METVCDFFYLFNLSMNNLRAFWAQSQWGWFGWCLNRFFNVTKAIHIFVCVIFKLTVNTTGYLDTYNLCAITLLERQVPACNYWEYKLHYNEYSSEFQARACQTL